MKLARYIIQKLHFQRKPYLKTIKRINSKNFNQRPEGKEVDSVIIHYTEISEQETIERFTNGEVEVSSHYMINRSGQVVLFVDPEFRAWHAGKSYWKGRENLNDCSIGIELVNNGKQEYTHEQYDSLVLLIKELKDNYPIQDSLILGHSDIAPQRKEDPGSEFSWERLHEGGIGNYILSTHDNCNVIAKYGDENKEVRECQRLLNNFGYQIKVDGKFLEKTANVIKAFKSHFVRHKIDCNWDDYAHHSIRALLKLDL